MAPKTFKELCQALSEQQKRDRELQKQKDNEFAEKHPILNTIKILLSISFVCGFFYTFTHPITTAKPNSNDSNEEAVRYATGVLDHCNKRNTNNEAFINCVEALSHR